MEKKRALLWLGFLVGATTLAVIPEFFWTDDQLTVQNPVQAPSGPSDSVPVDSAMHKPAVEASRGSPLEQDQALPIPRADLFAAHDWYVAPAPPALPPPPVTRQVATPARPAAPPVPFTFIGTVSDEEQLHIVLQRGQTIHVVSVGDVIDETYRVEGLRGREVTLVYLPMDLSQSVLVGSASGRRL